MQPEDVQLSLRGDVSDAALQQVLAALRADPSWALLEPFRSDQEWVFQAVYRPTGTPYGFPATRVGADTWHCARRGGWLGR